MGGLATAGLRAGDPDIGVCVLEGSSSTTSCCWTAGLCSSGESLLSIRFVRIGLEIGVLVILSLDTKASTPIADIGSVTECSCASISGVWGEGNSLPPSAFEATAAAI